MMSFLRSLVTLTLILGWIVSSNLFQNGFSELVLIVTVGFTGLFIWSEMPKRIREMIRKFFSSENCRNFPTQYIFRDSDFDRVHWFYGAGGIPKSDNIFDDNFGRICNRRGGPEIL